MAIIGLVLLLLACSTLGAAPAGAVPTCLSPNVDLSASGPCGCTALTGGTETQQNGPYNLCKACQKFKPTSSDSLGVVKLLTYKLCLQIVGEFKANPTVLGGISDPVWGTYDTARVLGSLKCIYYLAKNHPNPQSAPFWACNNYNLRGDAYASTVVPPPRVGYIRAALNGDTTWYVASAINYFGQFRLTRSKSSALLVWFDPGSPAFAIETLNAPNFDPSLALTSAPDLGLFANKPAEGFIGGIPGNHNPNDLLTENTADYVFVGKAFPPIPAGGQSIRFLPGRSVQSFIWSYNPTSKALTAQWQNPGGSLLGVKFVQAWEGQTGFSFLPDGVYYLSATTAVDDIQLFCRKYCYGENGVNNPAQLDCKDRPNNSLPYICPPERDTGEVTLSFEAGV